MEDSTSSSPLSSVPSSPLSLLSRSPTPPSDDDGFLLKRKPYPSPSSSQQSSQTGSPCPDAMATTAAQEGDAPPRKKRRITEPKPRVTETLELGADHAIDEQKPQLEKLLKLLHKRRKIVVIAGAGISVSAGIPDFRSSTGLFKSLKNEHNLKSSGKDLFDASVYKDDNSTTTFHAMVRNLSQATKTAQPTAFHHLLATLAHEGRLLRLYSQNVDGIDTALPPLATRVPLRREDGAWPKTVQLHGGLDKMVCVKCHTLSDFEPDLFDGPVPPHCRACEAQDNVRTEHAGKRSHGIGRLRPRMVLYNEHNPDDEAIGSVTSADLKARPDAVIVVGTTLKVPGVRRIAREMCKVVRDRRDGLTVWINNDPAPIDKQLEWDLIVHGPCDEVARHAAMRKWDDVFEEVSDEDMRKAKENEAKVIVLSPAKPKSLEQVNGMPTPIASPKFPAQKMKKPDSTMRNSSAPAALLNVTKAKAKPGPKPKASGATNPVARKKSDKPAKKALAQPAKGKISQTFKISKAAGSMSTISLDAKDKSQNPRPQTSTKPAAAAEITLKPQVSMQNQLATQFKSQWTENSETSTRWKHLSTPRRSWPMAPLSPSAARNNAGPPFEPPSTPTWSPLTGHRSKSLDLGEVPESPTRAIKRRSSGSISPTGAIPRGMESLIE